MNRRAFLTMLGGVAATSVSRLMPARAQQPRMPVVGYLGAGSPQPHNLAAFHRGLAAAGYVENRNVLVEHRRTIEYDRLPALAAELVRRNVTVILAGGTGVTGLAAKAATTTIPIVFVCAEDPVQAGLVDNLNRPGGNVTGVSFFASPLEQKRVELLRELLPAAGRIGALVNADLPDAQAQIGAMRAAAASLGQQLTLAAASKDDEIEAAFASLVAQQVEAILVGSDPFLFARRDKLVEMAARSRVPVIYNVRQYVEAGGLLSYGTNVPEVYHQAGLYVGRILSGTKPAELPVMLPTKFELVINLKTARALGLEVPPMLLARADEVLE